MEPICQIPTAWFLQFTDTVLVMHQSPVLKKCSGFNGLLIDSQPSCVFFINFPLFYCFSRHLCSFLFCWVGPNFSINAKENENLWQTVKNNKTKGEPCMIVQSSRVCSFCINSQKDQIVDCKFRQRSQRMSGPVCGGVRSTAQSDEPINECSCSLLL